MTDKQAAFCQEYLIDMNATQAAIRAGYSVQTAQEQGARLLSNVMVAREIDRLKAERSRRTGITADRVLQELARIAFVDPTDVIDQATGDIRAGVCPDDSAAIASVKRKSTPAGSRELEIRFQDKARALEMLGKHLGLFDDKVKLEGALPVVITGGDTLED